MKDEGKRTQKAEHSQLPHRLAHQQVCLAKPFHVSLSFLRTALNRYRGDRECDFCDFAILRERERVEAWPEILLVEAF